MCIRPLLKQKESFFFAYYRSITMMRVLQEARPFDGCFYMCYHNNLTEYSWNTNGCVVRLWSKDCLVSAEWVVVGELLPELSFHRLSPLAPRNHLVLLHWVHPIKGEQEIILLTVTETEQHILHPRVDSSLVLPSHASERHWLVKSVHRLFSHCMCCLIQISAISTIFCDTDSRGVWSTSTSQCLPSAKHSTKWNHN